jgi:hypothetical protein
MLPQTASTLPRDQILGFARVRVRSHAFHRESGWRVVGRRKEWKARAFHSAPLTHHPHFYE